MPVDCRLMVGCCAQRPERRSLPACRPGGSINHCAAGPGSRRPFSVAKWSYLEYTTGTVLLTTNDRDEPLMVPASVPPVAG